MVRLIILAALVRVVAAVVLLAGPWTDEAGELAGWDVERFQAIADAEGRPWVDEPVEYPPGSVVLIEALAVDDVVGTHRLLVLSSLLIDGVLAIVIGRLGGRRAVAAYLLVGTPLVPLGLLRFDLWATLAAVVAVAAFRSRRPGVVAAAATVGALIKVWPAVVVAAALALGRWRTVALSGLIAAAAVLGWLAWAGGTLEPLDQVVSLRGATGWHVESIPGSLVALVTGEQAALEQNAYRIGTLQPSLVLAGRVLLAALMAAALVRARPWSGTEPTDPERWWSQVTGVIVVGVTGLLLTAPLLSPQFLLWLTPWPALALTRPGEADTEPRSLLGALSILAADPLLRATVVATTLTGVTLSVFGPAGVDEPLPAALLLVRDAALIALGIVAFGRITSSPAETSSSSPTPTLPPSPASDPLPGEPERA